MRILSPVLIWLWSDSFFTNARQRLNLGLMEDFNVCTGVFSSSCVSPVTVAGRESDVALKDIPPFFSVEDKLSHSLTFFHFVNFWLKDCIKDLNTAVRKD